MQQEPAKGWVNQLIIINEHFRIGFSESSEDISKKVNFVQIVISTNIPWTIEKGLEAG